MLGILARNAVVILEPTALLRGFITTRREFLPQSSTSSLESGNDLKRNGFVELERWPR